MSAGSVHCFLVLFTAALVLVGCLQGWLLWCAFHADHRPIVQIRYVKLLSDLSKTQPFEFEITIVNKGAGHATICKSNLAFILDKTNLKARKTSC
jgi:hypothetical protein